MDELKAVESMGLMLYSCLTPETRIMYVADTGLCAALYVYRK